MSQSRIARHPAYLRQPDSQVEVRLAPSWVARIRAVLNAAAAFDPRRVKTYTWWADHFDQRERHHVWPKWLSGDADQMSVVENSEPFAPVSWCEIQGVRTKD